MSELNKKQREKEIEREREIERNLFRVMKGG